LIGVGVGPGDPELLTLKAVRILQTSDVVAYFAKAGNAGYALAAARPHLRACVVDLPLLYPVTTEISRRDPRYTSLIQDFFDTAAAHVARRLDEGKTVAVLSAGDPLFYGSYMHLHVRLAGRYPTEVIPGVSGMSGCWSAAGRPIAQGDDVLTVLPATLPEDDLLRRTEQVEAAVFMKLGRHLGKVRRVLARLGRLDDALYIERGTMADGKIMRLSVKSDDAAPYFAMVLLPGWQR
jgi:precorrin-2/cobalt-factor-2 C20-methyltransferase